MKFKSYAVVSGKLGKKFFANYLTELCLRILNRYRDTTDL